MRKRVYLILLSGLLAVGCTSSTQGTRDYSSAEMDEIKRRVMELQENATVAQVELERLRQQVANLEAALRDLDQRRAGGVEISDAGVTFDAGGRVVALHFETSGTRSAIEQAFGLDLSPMPAQGVNVRMQRRNTVIRWCSSRSPKARVSVYRW